MKPRRLLAVFAACCLLLPGCAVSERFDYSELSRRLGKADRAYAFSEADLFYADSVWYVYYSLARQDDTLLTLKEDETGLLCRITLACDPANEPEVLPAFCSFAAALTKVFWPGADLDAITSALWPADDADAGPVRFYADGFYRATLVSSETGPVFLLEYGELYEKST